MKKVIATLESFAPYSQGRYYAHEVEREEKENHEDYEMRTWRHRMHVNKEGVVYIPAMAFKNCLDSGAKFASIPIPGKGKSLYTKHFEAGVMVLDDLSLGVHRDDVKGMPLFVPSNGQRGGSTRVWKTFPVIEEWRGDVTFYVLDETITENVFRRVLEQSGSFIGLGVSRPQNRGPWGRFQLKELKWDV